MYKFFTTVLRNEFNRPNWQPILSVFQRINRSLEVILGSGIVALLVYLVYNFVPILENKRLTAIVILVGLVLAAIWLLAAALRFHEPNITEVFVAHRHKLHEFLQSERAGQLQITHKAAVQKQDALKRIGN